MITVVSRGTVILSAPEGLTPSISVATMPQTRVRMIIWQKSYVGTPPTANQSKKKKQKRVPSIEARNTTRDPSMLLVDLPTVYRCFPYLAPIIGAKPSPRYMAVRAIAGKMKNWVKLGISVKITTSVVIEIA
jgi:hypothetical protein